MIQDQVYVFLWSILIGGGLANLFDVFRVIRKRWKPSLFVVCLQDILYFLIVAGTIIITTFVINNGELRGYMILGYFVGVVFYLLLFSKIFCKLTDCILAGIERFVKSICNGIKFVFKGMKKVFIIKKHKKVS